MENIMDRVKTFEDAVNVLGKDHYLVKEYQRIGSGGPAILAYMKLRIIVAALNEGWKPNIIDGWDEHLNKNEFRYYPLFAFFTKEDCEKIQFRSRLKTFEFFGGYNGIGADKGFGFAASCCASALETATVNSCLCFKSRELSDYAGKQFTKLYFDFYTQN